MRTSKILRRRFRAYKRWFRKPLIVLQVEEEVHFDPWQDEDGERMPGGGYTHWRDASVEDIMCIPASIPMPGFPFKGD